MTPAYLLHLRPYRETSAIADFLLADGAEGGRLSAVVKGLRGRTKSSQALRGTLQPFQPLLLQCLGRGELKTLTRAEPAGTVRVLKAEALYSGLYLNEIIVKLLRNVEDFAELYIQYERALAKLEALGQPTVASTAAVLREFEFYFLGALGYGIDFYSDGLDGRSIDLDANYVYVAERGFMPSAAVSAGSAALQLSGRQIQAIREQDWSQPGVEKCAKQLARAMFGTLLDTSKLESRKLFL